METDSNTPEGNQVPAPHPFRKSVFRGMGIVAPPLLTILIFIWVISTTNEYVLKQLTDWTRAAIVGVRSDEKAAEDLSKSGPPIDADGNPYRKVGKKTYVPVSVYDKVEKKDGDDAIADMSASEICERYVDLQYLQWWKRVPFFLAVFILALYLLGKFMAAGMGRFFWNRCEQGIHRLPLIRNVYSSVKQISDFLFSERQVEYTRVVAVEYPRRGIWSLGLVTGDSMLDIRAVANEPVLSVLMCTSPMPMTGFTVTVLKSEAIDLNITIDQAFQFIISCGVVVPPQQMLQMQEEPKTLPEPE